MRQRFHISHGITKISHAATMPVGGKTSLDVRRAEPHGGSDSGMRLPLLKNTAATLDLRLSTPLEA